VSGRRLRRLECLQHEVEEVMPRGEQQVLRDRAHMFEEGLPGRQVATHRLVPGVEHIKHGMGEEGQQDQTG